MQYLIGPFYAVFVLGVLLVGSFVVFHLAQYSINRRIARFTMLFFIVGTLILLSINAILFFSVPFEKLRTFLPVPQSENGAF